MEEGLYKVLASESRFVSKFRMHVHEGTKLDGRVVEALRAGGTVRIDDEDYQIVTVLEKSSLPDSEHDGEGLPYRSEYIVEPVF
jgi:hypothetical protein